MLRGLVLVLLLTALTAADDSASDDLQVPSSEVTYKAPELSGNAFLSETFDNGLGTRWVKSEAKKEGADEDIAKYNGEWEVQEAESNLVKGDVGLVLTTRARHAAISTKLDKPYKFEGKPLVVQYEVKYQNGMDCGGSYMKLLSDVPGLDLKQVTDKSGYTIMFGPDTCGADKKLHFIMRHRNPKTGEYEEKHSKKASGPLDFYSDKKSHLFRLTMRPDNTWEVHVDEEMVNSGSLLLDMSPPINPPATIDDPNDFKPADWDDREKIPDPDATKPIDWDEDAPEFIPDEDAVKPDGWLDSEPELVSDPSAERPADWDEDMDGEWEAALIDNPKCEAAPGCGEWKRPTKRNPDYRGKWRPEMIDNPDYSGVWKPIKIANPDYFEDKEPYKMTPIGAVAFELWSMTDKILFDNLLITDDLAVADDWTAATWYVKRDAELAESAKNAVSVLQPLWDALEEMPWLWAVLVVGLLIPIGVIFYCCVGSSTPPNQDGAGERKKTDAPAPDDEEPVKEQEANVDDQAGGDTPPTSNEKSPSKSGRSALNKPADDDEEEEEAPPSQEEAESADDEGVEPTEQEEEPTATTTNRRSSPRKRKPRKE